MTHRERVDTAATLTAYRTATDRAGPSAAGLADVVWERLDSDRWALEWELPIWLGDTFGLDRELGERIATSNVLGLAALRFADDARDGEIPAADIPTARRLSEVLLEAAFAPYRVAFGSEGAFWRRVDAWMAAWGVGDTADLAARGAPLRIPAYAICRLTGREAKFGTLERSLDHLVRALALYDDALDWPDDVAARRWNAFTEAALAGEPAVATYFGRVDCELASASALAGDLGIDGLVAHIVELRSVVAEERRRLEPAYARLGDAAMRLIFGSSGAAFASLPDHSPA